MAPMPRPQAPTRIQAALALVPLATAILLAGCTGSDGKPDDGTVDTIDLQGSMFKPNPAKVKANDEVHFENRDAVLHNVRIHDVSGDSQVFDRDVPAGSDIHYAFPHAGEFHLACKFHPNMVSTVMAV